MTAKNADRIILDTIRDQTILDDEFGFQTTDTGKGLYFAREMITVSNDGTHAALSQFKNHLCPEQDAQGRWYLPLDRYTKDKSYGYRILYLPKMAVSGDSMTGVLENPSPYSSVYGRESGFYTVRIIDPYHVAGAPGASLKSTQYVLNGNTVNLNGLPALPSGWKWVCKDLDTLGQSYTEDVLVHNGSMGPVYTTQSVDRPLIILPERTGVSDPLTSDEQIIAPGDINLSKEEDVFISKTLAATDLENVFDVTLRVNALQKGADPSVNYDLAVVIVMDISNMMNQKMSDGVSRYDAVMQAAEKFVDLFSQVGHGSSKLGMCVFNTNATEIVPMTDVKFTSQAADFKSKMKSGSSKIIHANGYGDSTTRFTNIEGGLNLAGQMLDGVSNENKYIAFLSDGFATTYLKDGSSTKGYNPYTPSGTIGQNGVFYDLKQKKYCSYGTNYSDKATQRAADKAKALKEKGTQIYSIGVGIGDQSISKYAQNTNISSVKHSTVDRPNTTSYAMGGDDRKAFTKWLNSSIGSGQGNDNTHYHDADDYNALYEAWLKVFYEIQSSAKRYLYTYVSDLMAYADAGEDIEFISFYKKDGSTAGVLSGTSGLYAENTAGLNADGSQMYWNLQNSGYQVVFADQPSTNGDIMPGRTIYQFELTYRVRIKNEDPSYAEGADTPVNRHTWLNYKRTKDGSIISGANPLSMDFPEPVVEGYVEPLKFTKIDAETGRPLANAEFVLSHDHENCSICHGDGHSTDLLKYEIYTAVSNHKGEVVFDRVPSGHQYVLKETKAPEGYELGANEFAISVAYDVLSIDGDSADGFKVGNYKLVGLPSTGADGTGSFWMQGLLWITAGAAVSLLLKKRCSRVN